MKIIALPYFTASLNCDIPLAPIFVNLSLTEVAMTSP